MLCKQYSLLSKIDYKKLRSTKILVFPLIYPGIKKGFLDLLNFLTIMCLNK